MLVPFLMMPSRPVTRRVCNFGRRFEQVVAPLWFSRCGCDVVGGPRGGDDGGGGEAVQGPGLALGALLGARGELPDVASG